MSMNSEILSACDRVVAAVATGVYQGILIALVVGLGLRVFGRTNAATRHALWFATLALVACLIPAHGLRDYLAATRPDAAGTANPATIAPVRDGASMALASMSLEQNEGLSPTPLRGGEPARLDAWLIPASRPAILENSARSGDNQVTREEAEFLAQSSVAGAGGADEPSVISTVFQRAADVLSRAKRVLQPISWVVWAPGSTFPRRASLVLLVSLVGVGIVRAAVLLWRLCQIRKLKAKAVPPGSVLEELFQRLRRQLGVSRKVKLMLSAEPRSPVVLGFLNPVVLMPMEQPRDAGEAEAILRHELAHVCRRDDWTNLIQHVIQAILFFHPVVWWICRQISIQREIACDDYVLQDIGRPRAYALLLTDLASRINPHRALLAPGVTTSQSQLQKRIDMILNTHRDTSPRLAKSRLGLITSAAVLVTALAIYAAPRLVLAQASTPVEPITVTTPPLPPEAPAPEIVAATTDPSSGPLEIEPGAKVKTRESADHVVGPVAPPPPAVPHPPIVARVQTAPLPMPVRVHAPDYVATPRPTAAPQPPRSPVKADAEDSIEQRLRRLEKMVESLLQQKGPKQLSKEFSYKDGPRQELRIEKEMIMQLQETAKREAERQVNQARRATGDAEKTLRLRQERDAKGKLSQEAAKQLEALHEQRAMLEREVEKVERQIERLEQERHKLDEQGQKQSELRDALSAQAHALALLEAPCAEEAAPGAALPKK
jgi:beta-lactamase regulating signal transducer with metallopeptidase domain